MSSLAPTVLSGDSVLCSLGGPDKKFDAVVKRVRAQQEAQDKANAALQASKAATVSMLIPDAKVDWSKFRCLPTEAMGGFFWPASPQSMADCQLLWSVARCHWPLQACLPACQPM